MLKVRMRLRPKFSTLYGKPSPPPPLVRLFNYKLHATCLGFPRFVNQIVLAFRFACTRMLIRSRGLPMPSACFLGNGLLVRVEPFTKLKACIRYQPSAAYISPSKVVSHPTVPPSPDHGTNPEGGLQLARRRRLMLYLWYVAGVVAGVRRLHPPKGGGPTQGPCCEAPSSLWPASGPQGCRFSPPKAGIRERKIFSSKVTKVA